MDQDILKYVLRLDNEPWKRANDLRKALLTKHPELKSLNKTEVQIIPEASNWISALICVACGDSVSQGGYLLCSEQGHLTCKNCCEENKESRCQHGKRSSKLSPGEIPIPVLEDFHKVGVLNTENAEIRNVEDFMGGQMNENLTNNGDHSDNSSVSVDMRDTSHVECKDNDQVLNSNGYICNALLTNQSHPIVDSLLKLVQVFCPYAKNGCKEVVRLSALNQHYTSRCPYRLEAVRAQKMPVAMSLLQQRQTSSANRRASNEGEESSSSEDSNFDEYSGEDVFPAASQE